MEDVPIRPAATVIVVRDAANGLETLLLRRASSLVFHGGAWVFPGGRIDSADYMGAVIPENPLDAGHEFAARRAAAREACEEASLIVTPEQLIPFAHWVTPVGRPRRFSTWFYLTGIADTPVGTDGVEITEHRWMAPRAALALQQEGAIELPRPTRMSLERLADCTSAAQAEQEARAGEYKQFRPQN